MRLHLFTYRRYYELPSFRKCNALFRWKFITLVKGQTSAKMSEFSMEMTSKELHTLCSFYIKCIILVNRLN